MAKSLHSPTVALAVLGGIWSVVCLPTLTTAQDQDRALPANPSGVSAPLAPGPRPEGNVLRVHLLTQGRLLRGQLSEEGDFYAIIQDLGKIRIPKGELVRSFAQIEDVYQYYRKQLPQGDPDEHLKLARWCLTQKLLLQANEQLREVIALAPQNREAQAMIQNLSTHLARRESMSASTSRPSSSQERIPADPAVQPVGLDLEHADLRAAALQRARDARSSKSAPVIFDLPPGLAMKRAQEYGRLIHPTLQKKCATCHNENSSHSFQMIQVRGRHDVTDDIIMFNLDATLKLINAEEPSKSSLLINSLMPHQPHNRPILTGPNDPSYRAFWVWVNSLKTKPATAANTGLSAENTGNGDRFGGNRVGNGSPATTERFAETRIDPASAAADVVNAVQGVRPPGVPQGVPSLLDPAAAAMNRLPGMGPNPALPGQPFGNGNTNLNSAPPPGPLPMTFPGNGANLNPAAQPGGIPGMVNPSAAKIPSTTPTSPPSVLGPIPTPMGTNTSKEVSLPDNLVPVVPGADIPATGNPAAPPSGEIPKKAEAPKKPVKINNKALENFLKNRRTSNP